MMFKIKLTPIRPLPLVGTRFCYINPASDHKIYTIKKYNLKEKRMLLDDPWWISIDGLLRDMDEGLIKILESNVQIET